MYVFKVHSVVSCSEFRLLPQVDDAQVVHLPIIRAVRIRICLKEKEKQLESAPVERKRVSMTCLLIQLRKGHWVWLLISAGCRCILSLLFYKMMKIQCLSLLPSEVDMAAGISISRKLLQDQISKNLVKLMRGNSQATMFSTLSEISTLFETQELLLPECSKRDSFIKSSCAQGQIKRTVLDLDQFKHLKDEVNIEPYLSFLQGCIDLNIIAKGRQTHAHLIQVGLLPNTVIENNLVELYARCENMEDACYVFHSMVERDVVSWNVIIAGFSQQRKSEQAFIYFSSMLQEMLVPNRISFLNVLKVSALTQNIANGTFVHTCILEINQESDSFVGNGLIDMYAQCGSMKDAHKVFSTMIERNLVSWNMLICGYAKGGINTMALEVFWDLIREGKRPNRITFLGVLKACSGLGCLDTGKEVHRFLMRYALEPTLYIGSALIDMYVKCGSLELGRQIFNKLPERNVVVWTSIIAGYAQHGEHQEALKLFWQMLRESVYPNQVTFIMTLIACSTVSVLEVGKKIHSLIGRMQLQSDMSLQCSLVDMYTKCGSIKDALRVSDEMHVQDNVLWNGMIAGYIALGLYNDAMTVFAGMEQRGIKSDEVTFVSVLKVCANLNMLDLGKQIHMKIIEQKFDQNKVLINMLVDMYHKCGHRNEASRVFNKLIERDAISWNIIMTGHAADGDVEAVLVRHGDMLQAGVLPDGVTFLSLLQACGNLGALNLGRRYHACVNGFDHEPAISLSNTLIDMYAKCGSIEKAAFVFYNMPIRTSVSWNVVIAGYAQHGNANEALQLFEQMQLEGVEMDHLTLVGIVSACNYAGLVDAGYYYFAVITRDNHIISTEEAVASMVDLLGRAGRLCEAEFFMKETRSISYVVVWKALLAASRIHNNLNLGRYAAESVLELDPEDTAAFVMLSNIFAESV